MSSTESLTYSRPLKLIVGGVFLICKSRPSNGMIPSKASHCAKYQ